MVYKKTDSTKVRFERDGIYVINSDKQTKEKIQDVQNEGLIFWKAISGKSVEPNEFIKKWLRKGFIELTKDDFYMEEYKALFPKEAAGCTSAPIYITLGVTSKCNFRCKHCGNNSGLYNKNDLCNSEVLKIIEDLSELKVLKLNFTGGEPLVVSEIFNYIRYAKNRIPRITMTSNGSMINYETASKLKKSGLDMVKLSIDGLADFHDNHRNYKDSFKKIIEAIEHLKKVNIEIRVQSTLMKQNQQDLLKLMEILSELEISHHTIVPVCPIGRADKSMMLDPQEYKKFILLMYEKVKEMNSSTHYQIRPVFDEQLFYCKENEGLLETFSVKYSCEALKNTFEIQPNGDVVPCSFFGIPIGNVRESSLIDIWNSNKANEIRNLFKKSNKQEECGGCKNKSFCSGGCIANKYYFHGGVEEKDPYCFV